MQPIVYTIPQADHLLIVSVEAGPVATNGYLVADKKQQCAVIIDAPYESMSYFTAIAEQLQVTLKALWLTHSHWDHTADASLCAQQGLDILVHQADEYRLKEPMNHTIWPLPFTIAGIETCAYIQEGEILTIGDWSFRVIHTPGHTEGGVCFISEHYDCAFVGDTLFEGSIGRTDLPGGNTEQLLASIHARLLVLSDEMVIFPGHGGISTIGVERNDNPFLQ